MRAALDRRCDFRDDLPETVPDARIADLVGAPSAGWAPELIGVVVILAAAGLLADLFTLRQGVAVLGLAGAIVVLLFVARGNRAAA